MRRNFTILQFTTVTYFGKYTPTLGNILGNRGGKLLKSGNQVRYTLQISLTAFLGVYICRKLVINVYYPIIFRKSLSLMVFPGKYNLYFPYFPGNIFQNIQTWEIFCLTNSQPDLQTCFLYFPGNMGNMGNTKLGFGKFPIHSWSVGLYSYTVLVERPSNSVGYTFDKILDQDKWG